MQRFHRVVVFAVLAVASTAADAALSAQRPVRRTIARVASGAAAAPAILDTAITQLQEFLQRYPASPLRPAALLELGELLVRRADEQFAAAQRAAGGDSVGRASIKPDYAAAIAVYAELVDDYPAFDRIDAAQYTLGTLYASEQQYARAEEMFERVAARDTSRFRPEALFRLGDARFELASARRGEQRRSTYARAAEAYEGATRTAQPLGDIYFLSLYKLGWSYYNQANQVNQEEYRRAVEVFGRLVADYDRLTPEQQARLGLRSEAIEYMAIAFTQVGGAEAANQYFSRHGGAPYQMTVFRRVAQSLRDQGEFPGAVSAYERLLRQAPTDSAALAAQREIVDIYQNRMLQPDSAQSARLRLVEMFAPNSAWAQANPSQRDSAQAAREVALRQAAQYEHAQAQTSRSPARYADAARLYQRYLAEFPQADSARTVNLLYAEALFSQGNFAAAGAQYSRTAYGYDRAGVRAQEAGRNAVVAYDSALVRDRTNRAIQDSLFRAVDQLVDAYPNTDIARKALIQKGRRASETQRWDAMADAFRIYAQRYPDDPYAPTAQRYVGDALYRSGQYGAAQAQWEQAQRFALSRGRRGLADSIASLRTTAAASFADTLIRQGEYQRAAEDVYVAYVRDNPRSLRAADALRNAIETYVTADSVARLRGDEGASRQARERAADLSAQLVNDYPTYRYRFQYEALRARLLADLGRRDEAVQAYRELIARNPRWNGRADAMVRVAVMLDSAGQKEQAAQAYEAFAGGYPRDPRAPGALYNAGITYREAGSSLAAARAFAEFAGRFPRDPRAADARAAQLELLRSSGDTAAANLALTEACARPAAGLGDACRAIDAGRAFSSGVALFRQYRPLTLTIGSRSQLTQAGVQRASRQKSQLLAQLSSSFAEAIRSGVPQYLAAATYYVGLAQWEFGNYLRAVRLPDDLTPEQRQAAEQGATQQAEQYYRAARQTWQELVLKAASTPELRDSAQARAWVDRARQAADGNVDANPPSGV